MTGYRPVFFSLAATKRKAEKFAPSVNDDGKETVLFNFLIVAEMMAARFSQCVCRDYLKVLNLILWTLSRVKLPFLLGSRMTALEISQSSGDFGRFSRQPELHIPFVHLYCRA